MGGKTKHDYRWLDGSPWNFVAWGRGEPNNKGPTQGIFGNTDGWLDVDYKDEGLQKYKIVTVCQRGTMITRI